MVYWVIIGVAIAVTLSAVLVCGAVCVELRKRKEQNLRFKKVAETLGGRCLENKSVWKHPQIVVDCEGMRTRISVEQSSIGDGTGTSMLQVKKVSLITDGYDPEFKLSVVPETISSKATAWLKGNRVHTGRPDFDGRFVVAANQYRESIDRIISPEVSRKIMSIGTFQPLVPISGKDKTEKATPVENNWLERKRRKLPFWNANLNSMTNQINRHRFEIFFRDGKSEFRVLVQESEFESLEKFIYTMVDIQQQVSASVRNLEKTTIRKPLTKKSIDIVSG